MCGLGQGMVYWPLCCLNSEEKKRTLDLIFSKVKKCEASAGRAKHILSCNQEPKASYSILEPRTDSLQSEKV